MSRELEERIATAGEASAPPISDVPKQWLPTWLRLSLRVAVLPFVLIDYSMQRFAKKIIRPPFKQVGKCKRRGNCCYYILLRFGKGPLGRFFALWNTQVNGFYVREAKPIKYEGKEMVVMGCRHLKKDGSCSAYFLRPMICRQWPRIERFGYPEILKGCGYRSDPPVPQEEFTKESPLRILQ